MATGSLTFNPSCLDLNCERGNGCCLPINGVNTCVVSSRCVEDPIALSIVIPAVLLLFACILIMIAICKFCNARKETMRVQNFARKEMYFYSYIDVCNPTHPRRDYRHSPVRSDNLFIFRSFSH